MTQETVIKLIERECSSRAEFTIIGSLTTSSVYCIIKVGNAQTKFRISDHYAPRNKRHIRTLIFSDTTKEETVSRFIRKTIDNLKHKSLEMAFDEIKK